MASSKSDFRRSRNRLFTRAAGYLVSLWRPLRRRFWMTCAPPLLLIRRRNPCTRWRYRFLGWNVLFMWTAVVYRTRQSAIRNGPRAPHHRYHFIASPKCLATPSGRCYNPRPEANQPRSAPRPSTVLPPALRPYPQFGLGLKPTTPLPPKASVGREISDWRAAPACGNLLRPYPQIRRRRSWRVEGLRLNVGARVDAENGAQPARGEGDRSPGLTQVIHSICISPRPIVPRRRRASWS